MSRSPQPYCVVCFWTVTVLPAFKTEWIRQYQVLIIFVSGIRTVPGPERWSTKTLAMV